MFTLILSVLLCVLSGLLVRSALNNSNKWLAFFGSVSFVVGLAI